MSKSKNSRSSSSSSSSTSSSSSEEEKSKISHKTQKSERHYKEEKNADTRVEQRRSRRSSPRQQQSKWDSPEERKRRRSESRGRRDGGNGGVDSRSNQRGRDRRDYRGRDEGRYENDGDRNRYNDRRQRRSRSRSRNRSRRDYSPQQSVSKSLPSGQQSKRDYERRRRRNSRDDENKTYEWGKKSTDTKSFRDGKSSSARGSGEGGEDVEPAEKEKPNFGLSGALVEDTNKVNGIVVKYSEPPEARKPKRRWRLYPFKGETALPTLHIHRQSCFLVGRERKVVDLAVDHPSCSKQHAALQYRLVPFEREDGTQGKRVRLYLIDLDSANGTFLNNKKIDARKYYELMEKDVIKFGFSSREYVLLHENSKEDQEDDDIDLPANDPLETTTAAANP